MVGEVISKEKFKSIMEKLQGGQVWLEVNNNMFSVDIYYSNLEFLIFKNGCYQFQNNSDDEDELPNQPLSIKVNSIERIHRDEFAPMLNAEEIFITLFDGTEIFIECNAL